MRGIGATFLPLVLLASLTVAQTSTTTPPSSSTPLPELRIKGRDLSSELLGVNWFGFNVNQSMVDGLWIGGSSMATDFNTITLRIKLLGFNAVRLPFTFDFLQTVPESKVKECKIATMDEIIKSTIPPFSNSTSCKNPQEFVGGKLPSNGEKCNTYINNNSTTQRFLQVTKAFIENGMYVILDYQPMGLEPYASQDPSVVADKWAKLMLEFTKSKDWDAVYKGRVVVDIMNEPDSMSLTWVQASNLYLAVMDKLFPIIGGKESALFMVEGTNQGNYNLNWGDGFVTDKAIIQKHNIGDASVFFDAVVTKDYKDNVIVSPHMYGPTISKTERASFGPDLKERMFKSFMYLYHEGYKGKKFPIVLGEMGSKMTDQRDVKFYNDLAKFWDTEKGQRHWLWWAYNRNAGDTGGLVKENWLDIEWEKMEFLTKTWGLVPKCL